MTFETTNPNFVNYNILDAAPAYYPPKDANRLIIAAYPLIALSLKLKNSMFPLDAKNLRNRLILEIRKFETEIKAYDYTNKAIADACYILCDFTDDLILQSSWATASDWQNEMLLMAFENELAINRGKYFFTALKSALTEPAANLDLLELIHLFLILGYEGKYRSQQKGKLSIAKITNDLYECIDRCKVRLDQGTIVRDQAAFNAETTAKEAHGYFPLFITVFIAIFGCFLIYLNFNVKLNNVAVPIYKEIMSTSKLIEK